MKISSLFGDTLRENPAEADAPSHQLLLRAGYVRQLGTGVFSNLPLAWRSLRKIEQVLREEMDAIGGQELSMPVVHPAEVWKATGRWDAIGNEMVRFKDRRGAEMCLAMTHEEVVADLAKTEIRSYRQMPALIYQMQTKFRDEPRARGGLIRVREFVMKDSYSLDVDEDGLKVQYEAHYQAYFRIGARLGLPLVAVGSDVGMMGGKVAHEFMYVTPIGEDTLALCDGCGYAANREIAVFAKEAEDNGAPAPLEEVATPDASTIEALAGFLGVSASKTAKVVFMVGLVGEDKQERLVIGVVRGDMDLNPVQLSNLSGAAQLRPATTEEIEAAGCVAGYASPIGVDPKQAIVVVDDLVASTSNLVGGANKAGFHLRNVNVGRDYSPTVVGPIAEVFEGAACATCGKALRLARGVEVGNIFQLGTRYSAAVGATFLDENGREQPIVMGSYGIGVGRMLACVAEEHHDDNGLRWPISVAPFEVCLVGLWRKEPAREAAEQVYQELRAAGVEVIYDDRKASPGVKFADADLRGFPLRITVSDRSLAKGGAEVKRRDEEGFGELVPLDRLLEVVKAKLAELWAELDLS